MNHDDTNTYLYQGLVWPVIFWGGATNKPHLSKLYNIAFPSLFGLNSIRALGGGVIGTAVNSLH